MPTGEGGGIIGEKEWLEDDSSSYSGHQSKAKVGVSTRRFNKIV